MQKKRKKSQKSQQGVKNLNSKILYKDYIKVNLTMSGI